MRLENRDGRLMLKDIVPSSMAAKIPARRLRIRCVWLKEVEGEKMITVSVMDTALRFEYKKGVKH